MSSAGALATGSCLALLASALAVPAVAAEPAAEATVLLTRATPARSAVSPGRAVLVDLGLSNPATAAAAGPVRVSFPDLPRGVRVGAAAISPTPVTCRGDTCTVAADLPAQSGARVGVVLHVGRGVAPGPLQVAVTSGAASASTIALRVTSTATGPQLRVRTAPVGTLVAGRRAAVRTTVSNVAGRPARQITVAQLVPRDGVHEVSAAGPGWRCTAPAATGRHSCTTQRPIPVGAQTPPITVRVRTDRRLPGRVVPGGTAATGRMVELKWRSRVATPGSRSGQPVSMLAQVRTPVVPKPVRPKVRVPDWTTVPHLTPRLQVTSHPRAGGTGRLLLTAPGNGVGRITGPIRARLDLPAGFSARPAAATGSQWRCTRGGTSLRCSGRGRQVATGTPPPLPIVLTARRQAAAAADRRVRATVAWRHGSTTYRERTATTLQVVAALRVRAAVTARSVLNGARRTVQLRASVAGTTARQRPSVTWKQLSGPRVRWLTPRRQRHSTARSAVEVRAPRLQRVRTARFRVTATTAGGSAGDTITVRLQPHRRAQLRSRLATTQAAVQRAGGPRPLAERSDWVGHRSWVAVRIGFRRPGVLRVTPGQRVRMRATTAGAPTKRLRWRVRQGSPRLRGDRTRHSVTVIAPRREGMAIVGLRATTRSGAQIERDQILRVVAERPAKRSARHSVEQSATVAATAATGFCTAFAAAAAGSLTTTIPLQGGAGGLVAGAVSTTGASCRAAGASIGFPAARLTLGAHVFTEVTGQLSADGLQLTSGTYQPPASWNSALAFLGDPDFSFSTGSAAVGAPWSGAGLGSLSGSLSLSEFLFLQLPTGWTGSTVLTFAPSATNPLSLAATATDQTGPDQTGSVQMTGSIALDGTFSLSVCAANVALFPATDGSEATASGSGTVALTDPSQPVTVDVTVSVEPSIQLFTDFLLSNGTISWDDTGLSLSATGQIQATGSPVAVSITGSLADASNWSLAVRQTTAWVTPDLTVSALAGTLTNDGGVLGFTVTGQASNLTVPDTLTVASLSAVVTNTCPPKTPSCQGNAIRLAVDVRGTVTIAGDTTDYTGTLQVNLATMAVTFSASVPSAGFGPDGLQLQQVTIGFDNSGDPISGGACAGGGAGDVVTFSAQIDALFGADDATVTGVLGSGGYCLAGELTGFAPTGDPTQDDSFGNVTFVYSTYATTVTIPGRAKPVAVAAGTAAVYGQFTAPTALADALGGLSGSGQFSAVLSTGADGDFGFDGTVAYDLATPLYLTGSSSPTVASLQVDDLSFQVQLGSDVLQVQAAAAGSYFTPATGNGVSKASRVPLRIGVDIDLTDASFGFSATAAGGKPVANAFGQTGLTLTNLAVAGTVGATDSLGIAAQAALPQSWDGSLGVASGVPISLVVDISDTPCLQFSIGTPSQTTTAIDFMNEGTLVADYANVLLAPAGCSFADVTIAPGFALDFDGFVGGDQVDLNAALTLGSGGFALTADVFIGDFSIGGVQIQQTTFDLDLDPSQDVFDIAFAATFVLSDADLTVAGSYDQQGSTTTASFSAGDGTGDIDVAGFTFDQASVALQYASGPGSESLSFTMSGLIAFLGQSFDGELALISQNGSVQSASGDFDVDVDLLLASVAGPLQFAYSAGQGASGTFGPGQVSVLGITFDDVTGSLQPDGSYTVNGYLPFATQNASAADAWLYANEGGEFNTVFNGTLGLQLTGGAGAPLAVSYDNSSVAVWSEWSTHTWTSYGSWVPVPTPGCAPSFVSGDGIGGTPDANFFLAPEAVENASTGDPDDDTDTCLSFVSQIVP